MTYLEARNSGYPFNRRKYIDGWYINDLRKNIDYAMMDLSQRFWNEADLAADDWHTVRGTGLDLETQESKDEGK